MSSDARRTAEERPREIAAEIASDLFMNGFDERATHLQMMTGEKLIGGWSESAVQSRVLAILLRAAPASAKDSEAAHVGTETSQDSEMSNVYSRASYADHHTRRHVDRDTMRDLSSSNERTGEDETTTQQGQIAAAASALPEDTIQTIVRVTCGARNFNATLPVSDYQRVIAALSEFAYTRVDELEASAPAPLPAPTAEKL